MNRPCLVVVAVIVLTLSLSACRCSTTPEATEAPPTATPTEEPIEPTEVPTEPPTETPEPTNTPEPTDTPPPTRSSAPQGSGQGPGAVWLPPIEAATLTLGAYEAILGTADELQIEGITGAEAFDEFLSEAVMLKAVGDTVAEWAPTEDQVHYKDALQGYISGAQEALGQWLDEEITPAEVRGLLESDYDALGDMTQGIVLAANQDGLELGPSRQRWTSYPGRWKRLLVRESPSPYHSAGKLQLSLAGRQVEVEELSSVTIPWLTFLNTAL